MNVSDANILFLTTCISGGGAEKHFCRITPSLLRVARTRTFVSLMGTEKNYHIGGLPLMMLGWSSSLSYPHAIRSVSQIINNYSIDLLYSFSRCANFVAYCGTRLSRRRPSLVLGVNSQPGRAYDIFPTFPGWLWLRMKKLVYPKAELILCNSESAKGELVQRFRCLPDRVCVIRNPIPIDEIRSASHATDMANAPFPVPYFVTASRLCEGKGLEDLINAFKQICHKIPHNLIILGDGPLSSKLKGQANKLSLDSRVHFPGWVENPYPYYIHAHAFVSASYWEGQPNAVLEAMALGTPVISTVSTSWIRHYEHAGACIASEVGDQDALAYAMLQIAQSEDLRLGISAAAMEVINDYQVEQASQERNTLLSRLIESREL